jgi:hypothetical protein
MSRDMIFVFNVLFLILRIEALSMMRIDCLVLNTSTWFISVLNMVHIITTWKRFSFLFYGVSLCFEISMVSL